MKWWIWILAGLALLIAEVAVPGGIIMLFFAVSALILGVLVALDFGGPLWFQLLLFSVLSLVSLLTLRGPLLRKLKASPQEADLVDSPAGDRVLLLQDLHPQAEGRAEYRGSPWMVRNIGDRVLLRGQHGVIDSAQGLKLLIR